MKKFAYSRINKLCSMFLALGVLSRFHGVSFFFFGEPKYPSKDNYTQI